MVKDFEVEVRIVVLKGWQNFFWRFQEEMREIGNSSYPTNPSYPNGINGNWTHVPTQINALIEISRRNLYHPFRTPIPTSKDLLSTF